MSTQRYPVLLWDNGSRQVCAALVEDALGSAAAGATAKDAMIQLTEYIAWMEKNEYYPDPDLRDPVLEWFTIPVRPSYVWNDRIYSCDEVTGLRVPCVHGQTEGGMLIASAPTLGVYFHYHSAEKLKPLLEHHLKERLGRVTPRELSRLFAPKNVYLDELIVRTSQKSHHVKASLEERVPVLCGMAEPLGQRGAGRLSSRPWERESDLFQVMQLLRKDRASVLLVGPEGSGKSCILWEAIRRVEFQRRETQPRREEDEQEPLPRFWNTQAARIIAGMKYLGEWEERFEQVIAELSQCEGALCIENLLDLLRLGGRGPVDSIAAFMLPYLQRGELRVVGECTPEVLDACRRLLPGFVELFQIVKIEPFESLAALKVLEQVSTAQTQSTQIRMAYGTISLLHRLFARFRPYDAFPGHAVRFLHALYADARRHKVDEINAADLLSAFIMQSGVPESFLRDDLAFDEAGVLKELQSQVLGQEEACRAVLGLITQFKAGLNDPQRPLGVLLFCGPTGVGKTELARALSKTLFGGGENAKERLIRLDMSEYSEHGAAERLMGTSREPGELIKKIRHQPFSVVLFDEIEKAAPEIFDMLLGVFDEGRLTDPLGRLAWFRSSVIILTSNLGAEKLNAAGFHSERTPSYASEALKFFRPEFVNRIDEVIGFQPMSAELLKQIAAKELNALSGREGLKARGLTLNWTPEVLTLLAQLGYDKRYGARPLQRTLERLVVAPVSKYLLAHRNLKNTALQLSLAADGKIIVE